MTATDATNGSPQDAEELRRQLETQIQASVADLQYLKQSRDALLTHPSRVFAIDRDAASCRVALVNVVTAIDRTLVLWQGADFLHEYERPSKSNGDKIRALEQCFSTSSVQVCSAAVEDYLAVKYLRNAVVHVKLPTPEQAAHIKSRKFPVEPRNLNSRDWDRIVATAAQILRYISQAALHTGEKMFDERFILTTDLQFISAWAGQSGLPSMLVRSSAVQRIWWHNLECLSEWLTADLSQSFSHRHSDDLRLAFDVAIESWNEHMRAYESYTRWDRTSVRPHWVALRKLIENSVVPAGPPGQYLSELAAHSEDIQLMMEGLGFSPEKMKGIQHALEKVVEVQAAYPSEKLVLWSRELPVELAAQLLPLFVRRTLTLDPMMIIQALQTGYQAYRFSPNDTAVMLFLYQLPSIYPGRRTEYAHIREEAVDFFKLRQAWYAWVEEKPMALTLFARWEEYDNRLTSLAQI